MAHTDGGSTPQSATLERRGQCDPVLDTILVTGNLEGITEGALKFYFTSKEKCGGVDIINVLIQQNKAFVTFSDLKGT